MTNVQERLQKIKEKAGIETISGLSIYLAIPEQTLRAWLNGRNKVPMPCTGHMEKIEAAERRHNIAIPFQNDQP